MSEKFKTYQEYWVANHKTSGLNCGVETHASAPRVTCKDGFNVSIQAGFCMYSCPREYDEKGRYSMWELGFPTEADDLIASYAEDADRPLGTVYGYVPTEVVEALIEKHGGIA